MSGYSIIKHKLLQETGFPLLQENGHYILLDTSTLCTPDTSTRSQVTITEKVCSTLLHTVPPDTSICVDMPHKTVEAS